MPRTTRLVARLSFERREIDVNINKNRKPFRFILKMIKKLCTVKAVYSFFV